ncbi:MAG: hypothetical protein Q4C34_07885 [Bacteroidales bacterium]|nr:hypothetical protein [Bacteroidales bacterium]
MLRYLARKVLHRGQEFGLSLVEIDDTDVRISPFERETASTTYVDGTIVVVRSGGGDRDWHRPGDIPELRIER